MEVVAGDIIEIPHPNSTARVRVVVTAVHEFRPVAGRIIAYLASDDGMWVHHLGANSPIGELAEGAFLLSGCEVTDRRSIARTVDLLEDIATRIRSFAREMSGSVGALR
jgi:hypothetical protein